MQLGLGVVSSVRPTALALVMGLLTGCGQPAEFIDSQGQTLALSSWQGKPLLVNYFAPWCAPCLREMPLLEQWAKRKNMALLVIHYDGADAPTLAQLKHQWAPSLTMVSVKEDAHLPFAKPSALPTSYLLNDKGQLQQTFLGEFTKQKLNTLLAK